MVPVGMSLLFSEKKRQKKFWLYSTAISYSYGGPITLTVLAHAITLTSYSHSLSASCYPLPPSFSIPSSCVPVLKRFRGERLKLQARFFLRPAPPLPSWDPERLLFFFDPLPLPKIQNEGVASVHFFF